MRTESDLRAALHDIVAQAPAATKMRGSTARPRPLLSGHFRTSIFITAAVGVVIGVLLGAWAVLGPNRNARPDAPPPSSVIPTALLSWSMTYGVTAPTGWRVSQEEVYRDAEQIVLSPTGSGRSAAHCSVVVEPSRADDPALKGAAVEMGGRRGVFVPATSEDDGAFSWHDSTEMTTTASCAGVADPQLQISEVVRGVHTNRHDVRVPFTIRDLPAELQVKTVYGGVPPVDQQGVDIGDSSEPRSLGRITVFLQDHDPLQPVSGDPGQRITVSGREGVLVPHVGSLCFPGRPTVCVLDTGAAGDPSWTSPSDEVKTIFTALHPVANLANESTWPTATDALPR